MSRRRRERPLFEEIAEGFENLPLRVGLGAALALAVVGWALPLIFPAQGPSIAGSLAVVGRYLIWLLALMIALSSLVGAIRRWSEGRRFDSDAAITDLSWSEFEAYLAEYFRRRGCTVRSRGGASADGGVDLVVEDGSGRRIVQAKHWKTRSVGVVPLRALWGVLGDERAQGAVFVTSGRFTPDALAFAEGKRLELVDGGRLRQMVAEVKGAPTPVRPSVEAREACPECKSGVLQRRLARRGPNAGSYFLGCSRYPECRYTRSLSIQDG